MKVINTHQRLLYAQPAQAGALLDQLASPADALWPRKTWPRMAFDRPLGVGAVGGHGPIRYTVEAYVPGESVRFRFTAPRGLNGWHALEILEATAAHCVLEHRVEMTLTGSALLSWPLVFRPLHDALVEDAMAHAQAALGNRPLVLPWSPWVRLLRRAMTRTARPQTRFEEMTHAR